MVGTWGAGQDLYYSRSRTSLNKGAQNSMNITEEKTSNSTLKKTTGLSDEIQRAEGKPIRRLLFLSHATPDDSPFAKWLATQLAIAGYEVWCDVTQLLGGERFWRDIAEAIDAYAFRFLFVSTRQSNTKDGTLRELNLAAGAQQKRGPKNFIVPLKLDGLPFRSTHEIIRDLNFVRFEDNWAAGLAQLLALLILRGRSEISSWGRMGSATGPPGLQTTKGSWFSQRFSMTFGFNCRACSAFIVETLFQAGRRVLRLKRINSFDGASCIWLP